MHCDDLIGSEPDVTACQQMNYLQSSDDSISGSPDSRIIYINDSIKNKQLKFLHNRITTAKYNYFTFIPKFLFEQFSKAANLFFLFIAAIQQIGDISPTNKFSTIFSLGIVIFASMVKEMIEDRRRQQQDHEVNMRDIKVLSGADFIIKQWKDVVVGDVVRIENGNSFPGDIVILSSSEVASIFLTYKPDGLCYIETSNLDGETNLKIRQGLSETSHLLDPASVADLRGVIKTEIPNNSLYTFEGTLRLKSKEIPLEPLQLLLRGAMLRNTRWIYGIVVFTGHETKLMKNAVSTPIKNTKMGHFVNKQIVFLFLLLLAMAIFCAVGTSVRSTYLFEMNIIKVPVSTSYQLLMNIFTFMILFNNLIPLSLIVTCEIVKYMLGSFINSDIDIYHQESDTPAAARTSSLVEELGQVDYIFSDKTGTLTCNVMEVYEFRMSSIAGIGYCDIVPEDKRVRIDENGKESGHYDFKRLLDNRKIPVVGDAINEFLTLLAVCHTVIPEMVEDRPGEFIYQASSPDEGALVKGASSLGYVFHTRRPKSVIYSCDGSNYEYQVLNICEFNSTRKRMSAIVRAPDGKIKLYTKGADTVILERLGPNNPYVNATCVHLEEYANDGLRTLCIAYRDIPEQEYQAWVKIYEKASTTINNRQDELDKAAEIIERDLILLGATAIEDKLQDGVPDTIHTLAQAGIKIWVLTGDRQETAINIGYSCKLITEEMNLMLLNETSAFETKKWIITRLNAIKGHSSIDDLDDPAFQKKIAIPSKDEDDEFESYKQENPIVSKIKKRLGFGPKKHKLNKNLVNENDPLALVIDGKTLSYALEGDIAMLFLELATYCKAVICCRVSPLQKALVVKLVRKNVEDSVTLAIGDGANDVSMIQAAHVGVGISGMEGLQAARSADFAIGQFRFLRKLLLVHGGWAYPRMSKLILYSFYKNIVCYFMQLWFAIDNGFSGQTLYETWTVASYNTLLAVLQPFALGLFDQYLSARMLDRYPQLYKQGQKSAFYNNRIFFQWLLNCLFQSLFMYYVIRATFDEGAMLADGRTGNVWLFGETVYTIDLITIGFKAALVNSTWTKFSVIAIAGSLALWFTLFPIYGSIGWRVGLGEELQNLIPVFFTSSTIWLLIIFVPLSVNLRDYVWKYLKRNYFPESYHIIQEIEQFKIPDFRPRTEWFKKAVHRVRQIQRLKRNRGYAFSQSEGQEQLIRKYDTTLSKPKG